MSKGRKRREAERRRAARYVIMETDLMAFGSEARPVTAPLPHDAAENAQARLQRANSGVYSYELHRVQSKEATPAPFRDPDQGERP